MCYCDELALFQRQVLLKFSILDNTSLSKIQTASINLQMTFCMFFASASILVSYHHISGEISEICCSFLLEKASL